MASLPHDERQRAPEVLVWRKTEHRSVKTECERYEIRMHSTGDNVLTEGARRYRLFRQTDYWREVGAPHRNLAAAKVAAEADLNALD